MNAATRKWLEIICFEISYQLSRKSTWVVFAAFLVMLMGQTNGQAMNAIDGEILFHAPLAIAENGAIMCLVGLLVAAAVAGDAATRDAQLRIESLMHAAPIGRGAYLGGRFIGAFLVVALLLLAVPLAPIVAPFVHPDLEAEHLGTFRPAAYLQTYFLLIVPNAFAGTAILFSLATLVRHTMGSYLGAAFVLIGSVLSRQFIGKTLGRWELAQWLDPMAINTTDVMRKSWSPVDLNARMAGLEGVLLGNRLLWFVVALGVLAFTYTRFRYGVHAVSRRWWQRRGERVRELDGQPTARHAPIDVPRDFRVAGRVRQTLTIVRDSLREMVTGWSWLVLPFLFVQVATATKMMGHLGTPYLPTTGRVLDSLGGTLNLILVFIVLFAGELVWRERDANMQTLADTVPVPNGVRFAGKLLGLWLVVVALHAVLMLAGVLIQVRAGYYELEPALYLQILFGLELVEALVFALLALSVHVLVNHKHVGHVVMVLLVMATIVLGALGIEHPLLIYGSDPGWRWSPISGFGPYVGPVLWFELYWAAWTLLLAVVAFLFWVRGVPSGVRDRMRTARRRLTGRTIGVAAAAIALVLLVGGFIFYNTNVLNTYRSSGEQVQAQAEYERRYRRYAAAPQPQLTATGLHVELHPERREAEVRGIDELVNRTSQPIDTIHVAVSSEVATDAIGFDRPARAALVDDELGHRVYTLAEPVLPGQSLRMTWRVRHAPRGFPARGISADVVDNGSFIIMQTWAPRIGYQPNRELVAASDRKEHGLPERPEVASLDDVAARRDTRGQERIDLNVTIGTAPDQIAVAPGPLRRTWNRDGRRYFEYATAAPIGTGYALFSAKYALRKARAGDVAIEVLHHPAHELNVDRMLRGMQLSLAQYTKRFGAYPHEVLRMVEHPGDGGAHAATNTIWFRELFSLFDAARDARRIDVAFAVVAHETAHQFQAAPARVEGRGLLSESFAWYAALGVIEEQYGDAHLQRFLEFMRGAYLDPRARADVPLLRATDWLKSYRIGPFAMYALREYIGQDQVDLAWHRLFAKHAAGEPPLATSLDLYRELEQVTPDSLRYLLADLLERNTFWELETTKATAQPATNGAWQVSVDVTARKVAVDEQGTETNMPMNDLIELGVFAPDGKPLHRALHRVRTGSQRIAIAVPGRPARAGIDPRHLLIDVDPGDNVAAIGEGTR